VRNHDPDRECRRMASTRHCLGASVALSEAGKAPDRTIAQANQACGSARWRIASRRHGSGWACSYFALMAQGGHVP
jgi:hypothetical protein